MRAVTYEGPGRVDVVDKPEPEITAPDEAIVRVRATGVCGSDPHIYRGRIPIEPGFTLGHEYVGEVVAVGDEVSSLAVGDRVNGGFHSACGTCWLCRRGAMHKCEHGRTFFGHGSTLGSLQGTQAEYALIPHATAPFAGCRTDSRRRRPVRRRRHGDRLSRRRCGGRGRRGRGAGPRDRRPRRRPGRASSAGAGRVIAIDSVARPACARRGFGATGRSTSPSRRHATRCKRADQGPRRRASRSTRSATPSVLDTAIRLTPNTGTSSAIGATPSAPSSISALPG